MTKSSKKLNIKERIDGDKMDLSLSDITEIPAKEIAAFKRANNVDLSNNRIAIIGPSIALLNHITVLDLSKNHITVLPAEIGKLVNLRHLDLYNNRLDHLPIEMGKLRKLRYLDVKNNPLKSGIAQIVGQCLTTQECQTAAKKVVPFFSQMLVQIHEDRERLRKERDAQRNVRNAEQQQLSAEGPLDDDNGGGDAAAVVVNQPKTKPNRRRAKIQQSEVELETSNNSNNPQPILSAKDAKNEVHSMGQHLLTIVGALLLIIVTFILIRDKDDEFKLALISMGTFGYKNLYIPLVNMLHWLMLYFASFINFGNN